MMRYAMLAMMSGAMLLVAGCAGAGDDVAAQGHLPGKENTMVALSAAERGAVTLAATRFVETADRGLYKALWSGMPKAYRDANAYPDFEQRLASRKTAIGAFDVRKLASAEVTDASAPELGRGRFALVVFCTGSAGSVFVDAVVMKRQAERDWIPATYRFDTRESIGPDAERRAEGVVGPCENLTAGGTGP